MVHVQSCCFAYKTYCLFDVLFAVRVVGSYKSLLRQREHEITGTYFHMPFTYSSSLLFESLDKLEEKTLFPPPPPPTVR